jgi:hypothetical protein
VSVLEETGMLSLLGLVWFILTSPSVTKESLVQAVNQATIAYGKSLALDGTLRTCIIL